MPNLAGIAAWLRAAGFTEIRRRAVFRPPAVGTMRQRYAAYSARA